MTKEVTIPALGESITEVMVGEFYKGVGDYIEADENLVEIESEKATMDVPAPVSGVIKEIVLKQGQMANIGDTLVRAVKHCWATFDAVQRQARAAL